LGFLTNYQVTTAQIKFNTSQEKKTELSTTTGSGEKEILINENIEMKQNLSTIQEMESILIQSPNKCENEKPVNRIQINRSSEDKKNIYKSPKKKQLIDMENDKNNSNSSYNEKFFDYKSFNKQKDNLKRKIDDSPKGIKKRRHEWIGKDKTNVIQENEEMHIEIPIPRIIPLLGAKQENREFVGILIDKEEEKQTNPNQTLNLNNIENISENIDQTYESLSVVNSEKKVRTNLLDMFEKEDNLNILSSNHKTELTQISLALDSKHSHRAGDVSNNFNNGILPKEEKVKKTENKLAEILRMKKDMGINLANNSKNIPHFKINKQVQPAKEYGLVLQTQEPSQDEFYGISRDRNTKIIQNKINSINLAKGAKDKFDVTKKGAVKGKKEREKLNGFKCEICENFYDILGTEGISEGDKTCNSCSRHRTNEDPTRTPKNFYNTNV
jgi:hypothetical protein